MSLFESGLDIQFNNDGWGPILGERLIPFDDVPYAHFDKKDKCWRHADFSTQGQTQKQYNRYRPRGTGGAGGDDTSGNTEFIYRHDAAEDSTFKLVDTSKTQGRKYAKRNWTAPTRGGSSNRYQPGRGIGARTVNRNEISTLQSGRGNAKSSSLSSTRGGSSGRTSQRRNERKSDRLPSLVVKGDWEVIEEIELAQLPKLQTKLPDVEDLLWCGHVDQCDDAYDKISPKAPRPLRRMQNKQFHYVTTTEDPVIEKFILENVGNVFATDAIISHLMAASRSVYSWDIVIVKGNNMLFLDKRDNSQFDFLTVSETANEPPQANDDIDEINHPEKLSLEATVINQNFSQQILKEPSEGRKVFEPNPFYDEETSNPDTEPASVAYRYRRFKLGNISLVLRCELHGWTSKRGEDLFVTSYALNEWDSRYSGGVEWRQVFDQQRGAILANEFKNNSFKLGKWASQSILAGADLMKLGFVSRVNRTNAYEHAILATQFFKPKELGISMSLANMWGIVKMICDLMMNQEDGKYVLLKDPNKPVLRLYRVPPTTFETSDEEESDENSDDNDDNDNDNDDNNNNSNENEN
mmetsp:Transcript_21070/g.21767  ORF Transcript_21070/g.21767 Transcript_21070/m.21767 type:complete len:580 (+) Transcript_21070:69-1808(+)|eukprot:CAMPEP_0174821842 /NCGR_PEP_ID=MMETSP1107-20130205/10324_1 /TAXON_ID=36770 /ORGANISM="Paraphysomonas vestita, Strain GFlagA" /LENGTH=579 /DNA_ID=CAMNT_0016039313 /DNA_START=19 /DNA_END=1758 /DNA_ORIENTATION=+